MFYIAKFPKYKATNGLNWYLVKMQEEHIRCFFHIELELLLFCEFDISWT